MKKGAPHPAKCSRYASPPNLINYNKLDKGGHFAAWEQPTLIAEELHAGFKSLRTQWK
jgi:hypothetical protein